MSDQDTWEDFGNCRELAESLAVPREEWTEVKTANEENPQKPTDDERVRRSIWWYLFEGYETDPSIPPITDAMCITCPVIKQCFDFGTENGETGVYGGVYLLRGNVDEGKNAHKTDEHWSKLQELLNGKNTG